MSVLFRVVPCFALIQPGMSEITYFADFSSSLIFLYPSASSGNGDLPKINALARVNSRASSKNPNSRYRAPEQICAVSDLRFTVEILFLSLAAFRITAWRAAHKNSGTNAVQAAAWGMPKGSQDTASHRQANQYDNFAHSAHYRRHQLSSYQNGSASTKPSSVVKSLLVSRVFNSPRQNHVHFPTSLPSCSRQAALRCGNGAMLRRFGAFWCIESIWNQCKPKCLRC